MEKPKERASVVLLKNTDKQYCLARKKQAIHHLGGNIPYSLGMYNAYGGKFESPDTTVVDTALRELKDESSVTGHVEGLTLFSRVYFYTKKEDGTFQPYMDVAFFTLTTWDGEPQEGDEMGPPTWFLGEEFPFDEMMPADRFLFKEIFAGRKGVYEVKLQGKKNPPEIRVLDELLIDTLV